MGVGVVFRVVSMVWARVSGVRVSGVRAVGDAEAIECLQAQPLFAIAVAGEGQHEGADAGGEDVHGGVVAGHADGEIGLTHVVEQVGGIAFDGEVGLAGGDRLQVLPDAVGDEGAGEGADGVGDALGEEGGGAGDAG